MKISLFRGLSLYIALLALVTGGIIHIVATLAVPHFARASAFHLLADAMPVNRMKLLGVADATAQPLPYLGPDERLAVCRYDASDGPVSLTFSLPDKGWTLGLYTSSGDNFYVLPAQEARADALSLKLIPPGERTFSLLTLGGKSTQTSISQVELPTMSGFALIRAPVRGRSFAAEVEAVLRRASCEVWRG